MNTTLIRYYRYGEIGLPSRIFFTLAEAESLTTGCFLSPLIYAYYRGRDIFMKGLGL